ncbi:MAG: LSM domain-containing protein [Thermoplasmata archaeon]
MADPTTLLERMVAQRVDIRLKDDREISGRLLGSDEHLNLVLDETEERTPERTRRLGRVLVRGSNVVSMTAPAGTVPAKPTS